LFNDEGLSNVPFSGLELVMSEQEFNGAQKLVAGLNGLLYVASGTELYVKNLNTPNIPAIDLIVDKRVWDSPYSIQTDMVKVLNGMVIWAARASKQDAPRKQYYYTGIWCVQRAPLLLINDLLGLPHF